MNNSDMISRRSVLKGTIAAAALSAVKPIAAASNMKVIVVGAGAFGGWTALQLLRRGASVTLLDAFGPGNSRASSGGETRIIRATYGGHRVYTRMAARALQLWQEHETRWKRKVYTRTGCLWMVVDSEEFETASMPLLTEVGFTSEKLSTQDAARRYPQMNFDGVKWVLLEKEAGFLLARQACELVLESFLAEGGQYQQIAAKPARWEKNALKEIGLSDGSKLSADAYVFACGPWLGALFPELKGAQIRPSRQDVYFFGTPAGDTRFDENHLPIWVNHGASLLYGIPGNKWRGFKVADDGHGPDFDPSNGERIPGPESLKIARDILALRFPDLKNAPVVETRVCQYENSIDGHYLIDRHPDAPNTWIVGGGSGHGYKMGPALGEIVAEAVLDVKAPDPFFRLSRFDS